MTKPTTHTRIAHGSAAACAWIAFAVLLTLAPAGPAQASARHMTGGTSASSACHGSHFLCPDPRLRRAS